MFPLGSAHVPSFLPAGRIAAMPHSPRSRRTSTPPAENSRLMPIFVTERHLVAETLDAARMVTVRMLRHSTYESASHCHKVRLRRRNCMNLQPLGDRLIVEGQIGRAHGWTPVT